MRISKASFDGETSGSRFVPDDREAFIRAFRLPDATRLRVTVEQPPKAWRSLPQNRYWHAVVVSEFADAMGYDPHFAGDHDEVHEILKYEINFQFKVIRYKKQVPCKKRDGSAGTRNRWFSKRVKIPQSTANLSTEEFAALIERAHRLMAEMFPGRVIPDPVTAGYA